MLFVNCSCVLGQFLPPEPVLMGSKLLLFPVFLCLLKVLLPSQTVPVSLTVLGRRSSLPKYPVAFTVVFVSARVFEQVWYYQALSSFLRTLSIDSELCYVTRGALWCRLWVFFLQTDSCMLTIILSASPWLPIHLLNMHFKFSNPPPWICISCSQIRLHEYAFQVAVLALATIGFCGCRKSR